ncbi:MAG: hypothetical protein ABJA90_09255 [Ginsengibacter sp.]
MNTFYTAYKKLVHGTTFYFVKKFSAFPEFEGVPNILESYGMHTDFSRACRIAKLQDSSTMQKLLREIETERSSDAKVIHMNSQSVFTAAQ